MVENMKPTKQIIVIRKDLKMRRGKECSQAAHASMAFLTKHMKNKTIELYIKLFPWEKDWLDNSFRKITCQVNSLEEILDLKDKCRENNIEFNMITDNGITEFRGKPTITCCAIGPDYDEKIDKICSHLKLY